MSGHAIRALRDLKAEIESMPIDRRLKQSFSDVLKRVCLNHGVEIEDKGDRDRLVLRLWESGVPRSAICARLMTIYGISRSQGYRTINKIIELSHLRGMSATQKLENSCNPKT